MNTPTVFVLKAGRPCFFYICGSTERAHLLARSIVVVFQCPAWVEEYLQPAHTERIHAFAEWRERQQHAAALKAATV